MRVLTRGCRTAGLLAVAAGLALAPASPAQDRKIEEVTFPTVDKVNLKGTFYRGGGVEGRKSPCVMLLHAWGSDRTKGDWDKLATQLQAKGYSVLAFDFRGHGNSKEVRDKDVFWNQRLFPQNVRMARPRNFNPVNPPTRIDYKDFHPFYLPYVLNDIAAARRFLDGQNDAGFCNSGKIFVVGEGEGATLGMLWIASEYLRAGIAPTVIGGPVPNHNAGTDIAGAVWLSIRAVPLAEKTSQMRGLMPYLSSPLWSTRTRPPGKVVEPLKEKTSMCFIYGEKDALGARDASFFYKNLFQAHEVAKSDQTKYLAPVKGTELRGVQLLGKDSLGTQKTIEEFLDEIKDRGVGNNWVTRNIDKIDLYPVPLDQLGIRAP